MADDATVVIRFKEVEHDDEDRKHLEARCEALATEFPETHRFEVSVSPQLPEFHAQAHVTGDQIDAAAHANEGELRLAADRALDKLERELRRIHDKRIFSKRREAQKSSGKRT